MFERFTDSSKQAVELAVEEARELCHNYVGTEHLLLGILRAESAAAGALSDLDFTLDGVRERLVELIGRGKSVPRGKLPFTPRAKKTLDLGLREALKRGHNVVAPGHLLLGILREGRGVAAQILFAAADRDQLSEAAETSVQEYSLVDLGDAVGRRTSRVVRGRRPQRRRAAGGEDIVESFSGPETMMLLERLAKVEDARLQEATARAAAEARLERMEGMRRELDHAQDEIRELRSLLRDAGIEPPKDAS